MAANVETMFYTRQKPWHGLGTMVAEAPTSKEALSLAGLDWKVLQQPVQTVRGIPLKGYLANIRSTDGKVLGVVTDKYRVVQNEEAFAFTDSLLGEVTAKMAESITAAGAKKVLIPMNKCNTLIAGINGETVSDLTEDAVKKICRLAAEEK